MSATLGALLCGTVREHFPPISLPPKHLMPARQQQCQSCQAWFTPSVDDVRAGFGLTCDPCRPVGVTYLTGPDRRATLSADG